MQKVVEMALGILPTTVLSPADKLDQITAYIRLKRNIALDRVAFEESEQSAAETFDDFYIRLRSLTEVADLCATCLDTRMTTRVMAGIRNPGIQHEKEAAGPAPIPYVPTSHQYMPER